MEKHYTLQKAAELLGVTTQTLRNWDNAGKIRAIRTPGNQRRIPESEIARILGDFGSEVASAIHEPQRSTTETIKITDSPIVVTNEENYILMCRDIEVYDISKDLILNKSLLPGCMLKGTMNYQQWMETRFSKDTNFSSQNLMFRAFGTYDHEHAKSATGAFSLSDCYWLKKQDEDISFMDLTPYIHKEWDGMEILGVQNDYIWGSLSNLFVSGKTDKRWIDAHTLLKMDSFAEIEPYNLCMALGLENLTEAQISNEGIMLSNFTSLETFYESMEQYGVSEENTDSRFTAVELFKEQAVALFVIDYLVENNDRHSDDYGYLRDAATGEYISMAPFYNFDLIWSGNAKALPQNAQSGYREYIHELCRKAINIAGNFEYGTIIEKRAGELLQN